MPYGTPPTIGTIKTDESFYLKSSSMSPQILIEKESLASTEKFPFASNDVSRSQAALKSFNENPNSLQGYPQLDKILIYHHCTNGNFYVGFCIHE